MRKIFVAESAGFCWGVERALDLAVESSCEKTATLGPLIHNPDVVNSLKQRGIDAAEDLEDAAERGIRTIIFRSHGVTAEAEEEARSLGLHVIDATCPYVHTSQRYAMSAAKQNKWVFIVGNPSHPEILSIQSRALRETEHVRVLANREDAQKVPAGLDAAILAQTTYPPALYQEIASILEAKCVSLKVYKTICSATKERQNDSAKLASFVDCVIVIGGGNSANTAKLVDICKKKQSRTFHIERAEELEEHWFSTYQTIGITAGASTPKEAIEGVVMRVKQVWGEETPIEVISDRADIRPGDYASACDLI